MRSSERMAQSVPSCVYVSVCERVCVYVCVRVCAERRMTGDLEMSSFLLPLRCLSREPSAGAIGPQIRKRRRRLLVLDRERQRERMREE